MKKTFLSTMATGLLAAAAWGLTQTGMPALDDLRADVDDNGPLSRKLGLSEDQREKIEDVIDKESERLVKLRDELVAAEKKNEGVDKARSSLSDAREDAFRKLEPHLTAKQYEELQKWRAEGKVDKSARDERLEKRMKKDKEEVKSDKSDRSDKSDKADKPDRKIRDNVRRD